MNGNCVKLSLKLCYYNTISCGLYEVVEQLLNLYDMDCVKFSLKLCKYNAISCGLHDVVEQLLNLYDMDCDVSQLKLPDSSFTRRPPELLLPIS